ncbi:MAG: acyl-CoA synthetase [Gammaproteobacteria bacterium]|nr:acyl-CoA synthetase [Gammaproteobacteria bacterium]
MYPGHWATVKPDETAVVNTRSGECLTWSTLNDRSNRIAQLLRARGLDSGDHIALLMENHLDFFCIAWAAFRSGLYLTCVNRYLTAEEAAYIINDSESRALFTSFGITAATALPALIADCPNRISRGEVAGFEDFETLIKAQPATALAEEPMGDSMLYTSGTTGRPKGIKRPLTGKSVTEGIPGLALFNNYNMDENTRYLSPAPLYHSAPFSFCMCTMAMGGSVYMMEHFDPEQALADIERFAITHSQWVPTMFIRMLKLDAVVRTSCDVSSLQYAIHAAAPCPLEVKKHMMEWWGPILWEYYAGTERNGSTIIGPHEWLKHQGSVGRALTGILHICDEQGNELTAGEPGMIYFEQADKTFEYHNATDKTSNATHPEHPTWTTMGDVGYVDEEGYLYLTDRKDFMIISGGVNIYPQEIEDALILHDKVQDVAVLGVPNDDFGEEVKAVVQTRPGVSVDQKLIAELDAYARERLAGYKVPRSYDFMDELPRLPTGKLYKRLLKEKYSNR